MTIESFEIVPYKRPKINYIVKTCKSLFVLTQVMVSLAMNSASNSFIITALGVFAAIDIGNSKCCTVCWHR